MIYKPIKWEEKVRWCFETIFQEHFKKCRPLWLNGLELDGYCEKLQLAFEFQGPHHYEDYDYKNSSNTKINSNIVIQRDKIKLEICKSKNIKLFIIPYDLIFSAKAVVLEIERLSKLFELDLSLLNIKPEIHYVKNFNVRKNKFNPPKINKKKKEDIETEFSKYDHTNYIFSFPDDIKKYMKDDSIKQKIEITLEEKIIKKPIKKEKKIKVKKFFKHTKFICIVNDKEANDYINNRKNNK